MSSSKSSISYRHREDADETFVFPIEHKQATFQTKNTVVMVESQDKRTVFKPEYDVSTRRPIQYCG